MTDHPVGALITDRLKVFVSSTLKECAEERVAAKKAIRSINHDAVLFEDVGARPYPPRDVYRPRLEAAHLFVGIYRLSYGWVAPDMDVSGLEDELQLAEAANRDRLLYVYSGEGDREQRLEALIRRAMDTGVTVAKYSDPEELCERIRDDLTAVISGHFAAQASASAGADAQEVLESILPQPAHRLTRPEVEGQVLRTLDEGGRVFLVGPLGSGKTVLLGQLAARLGWAFVDGRGLNRVDLLARVINLLRVRGGRRPVTFPSEAAAIQALRAEWAATEPLTLVVDAPETPSLIWQLPADANRRLIVSARQIDRDVPVIQRFTMPPLTASEVETWITTLRGRVPNPTEAAELVRRSRGYPLYLRFYASEGEHGDRSLQELELQALSELSPRAQELLYYLAMAGRPLSLGTLAALLSPDAPEPESAARLVDEAASLVRQATGKVSIIHEHSEQTLRAQLEGSPARLGYFGAHLGRHLEATGDYVGAFRVFDLAGEGRRADRIVDRAAQQVAIRGGGPDAVAIFRRRAAIAKADERVGEEVRSLLALAQSLAASGARDEAIATLKQAEEAAGHRVGARREVLETKVLLDFDRIGHEGRLRALMALRKEYLDEEIEFDAARVQTLVTAEHVAAHEFEAARDSAKECLEYFESIGDEYGIRVARTNLAVALIGLDDTDPVARQLSTELADRTDPDEHPRERAVLCNLLTRRYRETGDYDLAEKYALEAIELGEGLRNQHLVAINRINLGNVRRDDGRLDEALAEYRAADRVAAGAGLVEDEAAANELIASVHNQAGTHDLALVHAAHSAGLARSAGDLRTLGRAQEERAIALGFLGRDTEALAEQTAGVRALVDKNAEAAQLRSLVEDALSLCEARGLAGLKIQFLKESFGSGEVPSGSPAQQLVGVFQQSLPEIVRRMGVERTPAMMALAVSGIVPTAPAPVQRRVVRLFCDALLASGEDGEAAAALAGIAGILMATGWEGASLADLADLGDYLASVVAGVSFKPHQDGAAHWNLELFLGGPAIVTLSQLDDSPRSATVALVLVCLLRSLAEPLTAHVLQTEAAPRCEAQIWITARSHFEANIDPDIADLGAMSKGYAVTQSTSVSADDQPPTVVICADDFGGPWQPTEERLSPYHYLFAEVVRALVHHFLATAVEDDVLHPKILGFLKRIGYRGRDWPRRPRPAED